MEYYCYVWASDSSCYLKLLDKLQKGICRTVGPSRATSLEPLAHRRNIARLSLFYRYYFGRCSSKTTSKKIEAVIYFMKFLSPEVALYL